MPQTMFLIKHFMAKKKFGDNLFSTHHFLAKKIFTKEKSKRKLKHEDKLL
jgi:hypothetical protein